MRPAAEAKEKFRPETVNRWSARPAEDILARSRRRPLPANHRQSQARLLGHFPGLGRNAVHLRPAEPELFFSPSAFQRGQKKE